MSDVLDAVRAKYPVYADVPDDQLALAIGQKYPQYVAGSKDFAEEYRTAGVNAGKNVKPPAVTGPDPSGGNTDDFLRSIANDPTGFLKSLPADAADLVEQGAAAAFNIPAAMYREATGETPQRVQISPTGITQADAPLPFQPGQPVLPSDANALQPEGSDANRLLGGLTTPGNLALLPFAAAKPVQAYFATQAAAGAADAAGRLVNSPEGRQQAAQDLLLNGAMALGIGAHLGDTPGSVRAKALAQELNQAALQPPSGGATEVRPIVQTVGPPSGAATVTEPAAPVEAPTQPAETPAVPLLPVEVTDADVKAMRQTPTEDRPPDILDTIGDHYPNGVKFESVADHGDTLKTARGAAKELMSHTAGEPADVVLDGLHLAGEAQGIESVDELAQAMVDAGETRIGQRDQPNAEARVLAETRARDEQFAAANDPARAGVEAVPAEQLFEGDTVKLNGQPMRVTGFATEPESGLPMGVELEGAYGRQTIPAGGQLHIDKGSLSDANGLQQTSELQQGRVAASGTSAPRAPKPLAVPAPVAATPAPPAGPLRTWLNNTSTGFKSLFGPQALSPEARGVGNALRHFMGENALAMTRADEALHGFRKEFDRSPVPANWRYNPAQPLPHNYAIIDALERDPASLPQRYQDLAKTFRDEFDWRIAEIQKYAPDALQKLIANYFPHVWQDPKRAGDAMAQVATRLFAGRKEFLKQRSLPFFRDGLERGLKPVSDNPVDLLLAKMHSMDKFLLALKATDEFKGTGAMKFKYALEKLPDGWQTIDDPSFIVHAPPVVTIKEAYDAELRTKTHELLQKLGVPEKRLATLGGKRWGLAYESPEQIKTRFGGPMGVYWHELGHILDWRYDLQNKFLKQGKTFDDELRALADRRLPAGQPRTRAVVSKTTGKVVNRPTSFATYVRKPEEKMAVMSEAYVHAPEVFQRVAPTVFKAFNQFIDAHPELHDIRDIKPSLRLGSSKIEHKLGGVLKLGDWMMPAGPAQVIKNYLSSGLANWAPFRTFKAASNILNAAQLGLSGFHLGFTSLDAATSRLAIGIEDLSKGHALKAAKTFASVPVSPVTNIMQGARMLREARRPGTTDAETAQLVKALEQAGGRVGQDRFWQTDFLRRLKRAWHEGTATGYLKTIPLAPLTAIEQAMRPIMEYVVPRQKLGVFADMARRELERLGPGASVADTREAMRKAWDSVDNRMGQVVYDNLFYNRMVKDLALASFRAYGWQLGKYREGLGALSDTVDAGALALRGQRPEVSHRMAYAMALPLMVGTIGGLMTYLMTGQRPQDWRDYFMPRTGKLDANGNAARVHLPSYVKDVIAYGKYPVTSLGHSLNPMFSSISDLWENKDFYGTQIRNPDDPLWRQGSDVARFAAKQFIPFSVSGVQKLQELKAPIQQQILPFFGITPVPVRLTMSPAQELAAEITAANLPSAPRTQEQFDRTKLVREILQDFRDGQNTAGRTALAQGFQTGRLNVNTVTTILDKLQYTPLQFQVHHMDVPTAMRVWRVARPDERTSLTPMLALKVATSKTLTPDERQAYASELIRR